MSGMRTYLVERKFKLGTNHPTHANYVTPIRAKVEARSKAEAMTKANEATEEALETLNGTGKGEWHGNAIMLYEMCLDTADVKP